MLFGAAVCALAMLLLGFTRPFAALFTGYGNESVSPPPPLNSSFFISAKLFVVLPRRMIGGRSGSRCCRFI